MSDRPACCCPLCELECALLSELCAVSGEKSYQLLGAQSPILSIFPTSKELLFHLRQSQNTDDSASESDIILGEVLRVSRGPQGETGRNLVLLILMPAIHKASSQIAFGFPSLSRDDITQHLLTSVLEIVQSDAIQMQTSHFAFTITRAMRRSAFRWAIREADRIIPGCVEDTASNDLPSDHDSSLETKVFLDDFLSRSLASGLITPVEHELLLLFKVHGVSSEVLAGQQQVSEVAFRHRMQRVIEKLRRVAQGRTVSTRTVRPAAA
ncbi:MAG: sigma-70 family RNA polymerase sigma factor [Acidobacteria bacterium]|nr:sigma-70 family RNA polymerase sigma factor [Acidobacteriota bacterium]